VTFCSASEISVRCLSKNACILAWVVRIFCEIDSPRWWTVVVGTISLHFSFLPGRFLVVGSGRNYKRPLPKSIIPENDDNIMRLKRFCKDGELVHRKPVVRVYSRYIFLNPCLK
jgi:hypothetical protein